MPPIDPRRGNFTIHKKSLDVAEGTALCDNGHRFKVANFNTTTVDGEVKYVITGFCWECPNSVRVVRDAPPEGGVRDYGQYKLTF